MSTGGAMLLVLSIWLLSQVLGGQMLQRLNIIASAQGGS